MPERATVFQHVQLGAETTPGTAVPATNQLSATSIQPAIKTNIAKVETVGYKYTTATVLGQEWTEAKISGQASYNDLVYLFASLLGAVTPTQPDATNAPQAYRWAFSPSTTAPDPFVSYTVQYGDPVTGLVSQFTAGIVTDLDLAFKRTAGGIDVSGTMLGQALQAATFSPNPVQIPNVPITPASVDIFLDLSSAGLGTTKLHRVMNATWSIKGKYGPVWAFDSTTNGYVAIVERRPTAELKIQVEADAQGMQLKQYLAQTQTVFVRIQARGPVIGGTITYALQLDWAGQVSAISDFSDVDGVYAIEWTLSATHDPTWAKALAVTLTNTVQAL